jgi:Ni/Co efflux regulator RcnB
MQFHRFLLSTCAALCLSLPAVSLADPPSGASDASTDQHPPKAPRGEARTTHSGRGGQTVGGGPASVAGSGAQGGPRGQGGRQTTHRTVQGQTGNAGGSAVQGQGAGQAGGQVAGQSGRRTSHGPGGAFATGSAQSGQSGAAVQTQQTVRRRGPTSPGPTAGRNIHTPRALGPLSGWDRNARGPDRSQLGQQWRGQHHNWDQNSPWRGNTNWWRGQPSFRLFLGPRIGFFFFPDFGYVRAPQEYQNHYWRAGDNLPNWFWRYTVRNYERYGLPTPPDGCAWIWLDGDVALVDLSDGYILDIVYNVW